MKMLLSMAIAMAVGQLEYRFKKLVAAIGIFLISIGIGFIGTTAAILSFFFYLADVDSFVFPAFITSIITLLIAGLLAIEGRRLFIQ